MSKKKTHYERARENKKRDSEKEKGEGTRSRD